MSQTRRGIKQCCEILNLTSYDLKLELEYELTECNLAQAIIRNKADFIKKISETAKELYNQTSIEGAEGLRARDEIQLAYLELRDFADQVVKEDNALKENKQNTPDNQYKQSAKNGIAEIIDKFEKGNEKPSYDILLILKVLQFIKDDLSDPESALILSSSKEKNVLYYNLDKKSQVAIYNPSHSIKINDNDFSTFHIDAGLYNSHDQVARILNLINTLEEFNSLNELSNYVKQKTDEICRLIGISRYTCKGQYLNVNLGSNQNKAEETKIINELTGSLRSERKSSLAAESEKKSDVHNQQISQMISIYVIEKIKRDINNRWKISAGQSVPDHVSKMLAIIKNKTLNPDYALNEIRKIGMQAAPKKKHFLGLFSTRDKEITQPFYDKFLKGGEYAYAEPKPILTTLPLNITFEYMDISARATSDGMQNTTEIQNLVGLYLDKLLHHVVLGEQKEAEDIIKKYPESLLLSSTVEDYSYGLDENQHRKIQGTALQIALGAKDVGIQPGEECMVEMIMRYLKELPDGEKVIADQIAEQFPQGWTDEERKKSDADILALYDIVKTIGESKDPDDCQDAMDAFRRYLTDRFTKNVVKSGFHFNDDLLLEAFNLFDENYSRFGGSNSRKNSLCRHVVGFIQRFVPTWEAQAFCQSIGAIIFNKELLRRSLEHRSCTGHFFPLVPFSGLGFGQIVSARFHGSAVFPDVMYETSTGAVRFTFYGTGGLQQLYKQKSAALQNVFNIPTTPSPYFKRRGWKPNHC